jgi:polar amino acid transport system substrate-binding protein
MPITTRPVLALMLLLTAAAAPADPRTINDAVYTDEQAEAGEKLYAQHCLTCHDKKYFRPVLKAWQGRPLGILYAVMSSSMPESNPGALPRKDYVDILAYILAQSRYPAGDAELDYENGVLDEILITDREESAE